MFVTHRKHTLAVLIVSGMLLPLGPTAADDRIDLRDGTRLNGELVELGGSQVKLRVRGGEKILLRGEILSAEFDQNRASRRVAATDGVVRDDGYTLYGEVENLPGREQVRVTLAQGGSVMLPRKRVVRIIRKGDAIETQTSVFTRELDLAIVESLKRLTDAR